jgi:hypothetical protein
MKSHYRFVVCNQRTGRTNPYGFFSSVKLYYKSAFWLFCFLLLNISPVFSQSTQAPQMPMQAFTENSLETSWLNKEVYKSLLLDNMEDLKAWSKSGAGEMSLTGERAKRGKSSIRLEFPANRPPGSERYPYTGVQRTFSNENWSEYNRISLWVYPELENAGFVTLVITLSNEGDTRVPNVYGRTGRHDVILENGKWNHVVWEIPDLPRDKVTGLSFGRHIRGKEFKGIADYGYMDFDLLELQKVDPDHYEGWNVAPGQIAFSHSGYQTGGRKTAIMGDTKEKEFSLIHIESGRTLLTGPAQKTESLSNRFTVLDFSPINQEGTYILNVGNINSRPFRIGDDVWKESIWKSVNYWYCQRCGQAIDGVHDACHQDVTVRHDTLQIVVNGGWHDAGDLTQMIYNTAPAVYAMFSLADHTRSTDRVLSDRLVEEALWGLDWILNTRFGNGYRHNFGGIGRWTDGIMGNDDDLSFTAQKLPFENFLSASAVARAALTLRHIDPVKADYCIRVATEDWESAVEGMTIPEVEICGEAIIASMNLYKLTGEEKYASKAIGWAEAIMESQQQSYTPWKIPFAGFFYRDADKVQILRYNPIAQDQAPIMALEKLCMEFPHHEQWINWYSAIVLHAEYLKATSRLSEPYGMIPQSIYHIDEQHTRSLYGLQQSSLAGKDRDGSYRQQVMSGMELGNGYYLRFFPVWFGHRGNFGIQLAQAKALAVASRLRDDLEGINLSRMQLEWIVGKNPFAQSTMWGEGYDFSPLFTPSSGHIVGGLPVGIQTAENRDLPFWPASILYNYKEIWSSPSARWLWLMEDVAFPSRIAIPGTGSGELNIHFVEKNTGYKRELFIPAGQETSMVQFPEGNYKISYNGKNKEAVLMPGKIYTLDSGNELSYSLSYETTGQGLIRFTVKAEGTGNIQFELRGWNLELTEKVQDTGTLDGKTISLVWEASLIDPGKPWVAVSVPDGKISQMKEVNNIKMGK